MSRFRASARLVAQQFDSDRTRRLSDRIEALDQLQRASAELRDELVEQARADKIAWATIAKAMRISSGALRNRWHRKEEEAQPRLDLPD